MELGLKQVAETFGFSEIKIIKWIKSEDLTSDLVADQYRFHRADLIEWAAIHGHPFSPGIDAQGNGDLTPTMSHDALLELFLSRESVGSSTAGGGIAIPHPREPTLLAVPGAVMQLYAVTNHASAAGQAVFAADVGAWYHSLTLNVPQAHWFEREIAEQWGVVPKGHPWLKPIRFHRSYCEGRDAWGRATDDEILPWILHIQDDPSDRRLSRLIDQERRRL